MSQGQKFSPASVYNAASSTFDSPALGFWGYHGGNTVERLRLSPGAKVLDVACGTGSSAIPAAMAVGKTGSVTAIDLSEGMLEMGKAKACAAGLTNIQFINGDMTALSYPDSSFDAVICVFGVFFVPDMKAFVAGLWRMVRPGGQLAVTSWSNGRYEPLASAFNDAVAEVRPDLRSRSQPWRDIVTPDLLKRMLTEAGVDSPSAETGAYDVKISSPDDWWTIIMGSGARSRVDAMTPAEVAHVRSSMDNFISEHSIRSVPANAIYSTARKSLR